MARTSKNIRWIKWHTKETLYGSFMEEPPESLGFFVKLCCFSAESRYPGYIQSEYQKGMDPYKLAALLNIDLEKFKDMLEAQVVLGRIKINGTGVMDILQWEKYQVIPKWDGNPDTPPPEDSPAPEELPQGSKYGHMGRR